VGVDVVDVGQTGQLDGADDGIAGPLPARVGNISSYSTLSQASPYAAWALTPASDSAMENPAGHDGHMAERDRDESGRPRSARPRDALGRPLPHGGEGVPRIPDDLELPPAETLAYAQDLLDRGLAFNAHEVLEAAWKNGPDDERMLWQGLAQLMVGITHVQRGNVKGAITLLRRASARLAHDDRPAAYNIDVIGLVGYADALINDLAAGAEIPPKRLRPSLVVVRSR
jgi:uncharacterized protein